MTRQASRSASVLLSCGRSWRCVSGSTAPTQHPTQAPSLGETSRSPLDQRQSAAWREEQLECAAFLQLRRSSQADVQADVEADVQHASSITEGGTIAATAPGHFHPRHSVATSEITLSLASEDRGAEAAEVEVVTHTLGGTVRAPSSQRKAPHPRRRCHGGAARKLRAEDRHALPWGQVRGRGAPSLPARGAHGMRWQPCRHGWSRSRHAWHGTSSHSCACWHAGADRAESGGQCGGKSDGVARG